MGNFCGSGSGGKKDVAKDRHVSAASSDLAAPLSASSVDVDMDLSNANTGNSGSSDVDFSAMNGTWLQDRHSNLEEYLTSQAVPWLVKKMIMKVKVRWIKAATSEASRKDGGVRVVRNDWC